MARSKGSKCRVMDGAEAEASNSREATCNSYPSNQMRFKAGLASGSYATETITNFVIIYEFPSASGQSANFSCRDGDRRSVAGSHICFKTLTTYPVVGRRPV